MVEGDEFTHQLAVFLAHEAQHSWEDEYDAEMTRSSIAHLTQAFKEVLQVINGID